MFFFIENVWSPSLHARVTPYLFRFIQLIFICIMCIDYILLLFRIFLSNKIILFRLTITHYTNKLTLFKLININTIKKYSLITFKNTPKKKPGFFFLSEKSTRICLAFFRARGFVCSGGKEMRAPPYERMPFYIPVGFACRSPVWKGNQFLDPRIFCFDYFY